MISEIYNAFLREGSFPPLLKQSYVRPLPKQNTACSIENDVRPVSRTSQVAKVMHGFTLVRMLPTIIEEFDVKQFAVSGTSTVHALVYLLHLGLEALDRDNCSSRFFF